MTSDEWNSCKNLIPLMRWLTDSKKITDRKLRLYACACWRACQHQTAVGRRAIEAAEEYADGTSDRIGPARADAHKAAMRMGDVEGSHAAWLAECACARDLITRTMFGVNYPVMIADRAAYAIGDALAADILRDTVGDVFAPVTLPVRPCAECGGLGRPINHCDNEACVSGKVRPWLTPDVLSLSRAAYECRKRRCDACGGVGGEDVPDKGWRDKWVTCAVCHGRCVIDDGTLDPLTFRALADALEEAGCVGEVKECVGCDGDGMIRIGFGGRHGYGPPTKCPVCDGTKQQRQLHPLLAALRCARPKYRGFWVADLLLGR